VIAHFIRFNIRAFGYFSSGQSTHRLLTKCSQRISASVLERSSCSLTASIFFASHGIMLFITTRRTSSPRESMFAFMNFFIPAKSGRGLGVAPRTNVSLGFPHWLLVMYTIVSRHSLAIKDLIDARDFPRLGVQVCPGLHDMTDSLWYRQSLLEIVGRKSCWLMWQETSCNYSMQRG
jgi:hypothetical protein